MPRIPLFSTDSMTPEQERVYDEIVNGPRGQLVGPLRASLHNPALADRWQKFGEILRYDTSLPPRLNELAILVTARRWNAQLEWHIHAPVAVEAGLAADAVEALRRALPPEFADRRGGRRLRVRPHPAVVRQRPGRRVRAGPEHGGVPSASSSCRRSSATTRLSP